MTAKLALSNPQAASRAPVSRLACSQRCEMCPMHLCLPILSSAQSVIAVAVTSRRWAVPMADNHCHGSEVNAGQLKPPQRAILIRYRTFALQHMDLD